MRKQSSGEKCRNHYFYSVVSFRRKFATKMVVKKEGRKTSPWNKVYKKPRFGSVRLRFGNRTVRAVPVFGSAFSSSNEGVFVCFSTVSQRGRFRFPVSVPGKRFRRFQFRVRFLRKRFRRFRFPVPVRFLGHPEEFNQCGGSRRVDRRGWRTENMCENKAVVTVPSAQR